MSRLRPDFPFFFLTPGGAAGIGSLVEDTTPQLGGDLDLNGNNLVDTNGNEVLEGSATASAVNHLKILNSATGNAPELQAVGDDTNIDLKLTPKGTGDIDAGTNTIKNVVDPTADQHAATKKYVDDNAGGGATLTTTWGIPPYVASTTSNTAMNTNTTGYTGLFTLTGDITVNKLSIFAQSVSVAGTLDIGIYSEDGQTKHIDITTASISAQGVVTTAVSAVALSAGNYYVVIVPNGTAEITVECFNYLGTGNSMLTVSSEPIHAGTQTVTASTLPATFDPVNDITVADGNGPVIRLDN